jgi:hypothetical protein
LALLLASSSTTEHLVEEAELRCRTAHEPRKYDEEGRYGPHFDME